MCLNICKVKIEKHLHNIKMFNLNHLENEIAIHHSLHSFDVFTPVHSLSSIRWCQFSVCFCVFLEKLYLYIYIIFSQNWYLDDSKPSHVCWSSRSKC